MIRITHKAGSQQVLTWHGQPTGRLHLSVDAYDKDGYYIAGDSVTAATTEAGIADLAGWALAHGMKVEWFS